MGVVDVNAIGGMPVALRAITHTSVARLAVERGTVVQARIFDHDRTRFAIVNKRSNSF